MDTPDNQTLEERVKELIGRREGAAYLPTAEETAAYGEIITELCLILLDLVNRDNADQG